MSIAHQAARGGRAARNINASIRRQDALKGDVLHNDDALANTVYAESLNCPICHQRIHPSNYNQHMQDQHPEGKPLHEASELLPLAAIRVDGGTQSRMEINQATVDEYTEAMQDGGAIFPALVVYYDGRDYWLADGFHRAAAAKQAGLLAFAADVRQGTVRDAVLHSVGANATHGLRRTNQDKRRAVERLLQDTEWQQWSDREIARQCRVGNKLVSDMRRSLFPEHSDKRTYTTKHGTQATMDVGKIGKSSPHPLPPSPLHEGGEQSSDNRVFADVRSGAVTYGSEMDTYVEDVVDDYVDDVPAIEVDPAPAPSGEEAGVPAEDRFPEGMRVRTPSGHLGTVRKASGRLVFVQTPNGVKTYDADKLAPVEAPDLTPTHSPSMESGTDGSPVSARGARYLSFVEQRDALDRLRWVLHDSYEFMRTHGLLAANAQTTQLATEIKRIYGDDAEQRFQDEQKRKHETRQAEQLAEAARPRARQRD